MNNNTTRLQLSESNELEMTNNNRFRRRRVENIDEDIINSYGISDLVFRSADRVFSEIDNVLSESDNEDIVSNNNSQRSNDLTQNLSENRSLREKMVNSNAVINKATIKVLEIDDYDSLYGGGKYRRALHILVLAEKIGIRVWFHGNFIKEMYKFSKGKIYLIEGYNTMGGGDFCWTSASRCQETKPQKEKSSQKREFARAKILLEGLDCLEKWTYKGCYLQSCNRKVNGSFCTKDHNNEGEMPVPKFRFHVAIESNGTDQAQKVLVWNAEAENLLGLDGTDFVTFVSACKEEFIQHLTTKFENDRFSLCLEEPVSGDTFAKNIKKL